MPSITTCDASSGRSRRGASKAGSHRLELVSVIVTSIWLSAVPAVGQSAMASETEAWCLSTRPAPTFRMRPTVAARNTDHFAVELTRLHAKIATAMS